jgi:type I restriction enzyme R subunit
MLNIIEGDKTEISPHFFDLIIVDESHRSIYNVYQGIIKYFNAIVLGLTATPTDVIDHNTFEVFDCEDGLPTFAYTFEEAVNNIPKYLNDFQVLSLTTKFQQEGIRKNTISLEEQKKLIAEGIEVEELDFEGTELEKQVTNKGTNALIVKEFMEEAIKDHNGVLPGKTIFFCMTKAHARRLKEIFDQFYPQFHGELAKVIVSDDPRVYGKGGLLDQFKNNDLPRIAISVDMLDTGIDIPTIVNLVFAKPVYSYTKFWQMIGRGTRVLDPSKLKSWCKEKDDFLIVDCWDNFEYFKLNPKGKELKQQLALPVRLFRMRIEKLKLALEKLEEKIVEKEVMRLKEMIHSLPDGNVVVMDEKSLVDQVRSESFWPKIDSKKVSLLEESVAPLMRTISGVDFMAMRFEKDLVETSIALLEGNTDALQAMEEVVTAQISELPLTINAVAKEKDLITKSLRKAFWHKLDEDSIEALRQRLSALMKYRKQDKGTSGAGQVSINIKDELIKKEYVEFGPHNELVSITRYKEMVEAAVRELSTTNLVLQKIKSGEAVTDDEVQKLVELLSERDPYVTENILKRVYDNKKAAFLQFIKHILGVENLGSFGEQVSRAFTEFIQDNTTLSNEQIRFLEVLKNFIIDRGQVTKKDLVNAPFTQLHPKGILGIFPPNQIERVISLTERIVA